MKKSMGLLNWMKKNMRVTGMILCLLMIMGVFLNCIISASAYSDQFVTATVTVGQSKSADSEVYKLDTKVTDQTVTFHVGSVQYEGLVYVTQFYRNSATNVNLLYDERKFYMRFREYCTATFEDCKKYYYRIRISAYLNGTMRSADYSGAQANIDSAIFESE